MKKIDFKAVTIKIISFLISIAIFFFSLASLLSLLCSNVFLSADKYIENCLTDKYFDAVYEAAEKSVLRATASVVTISEEKIKEVLDYDTLAEISREYTEGYIKVVFDGAEAPSIDEYECEEMRELVRNTILDSVKDAGGEISDEQLEADATEAYELLAGYVDISVKIFPTVVEDAMKSASKIVSRLEAVKSIFPYTALLIAVFVVLKLALLRRKSFGVISFNAVVPIWLSTLACVCPLAVLYYYDVASRLAVASGTALYIFISGAVNTVVLGGLEIAAIAFAIMSAVLIITLVLSCLGIKKTAAEPQELSEDTKDNKDNK